MTLQKLLQIEAELRKAYFERDEEVHGSIVALLARQHVLLLGVRQGQQKVSSLRIYAHV